MLLLRPLTQEQIEMIRSAASKVMWMGRATVFTVGLAVILALVFGVATTAMGANGKPFLLGKSNVATMVSELVNNGAGPALSLKVGQGQPPLAVNSSAKVADLNADQIDGLDSTEFAPNAVEAWRTVGTSEFQNGWSNYGGQNVSTAAFYKDPWGVVHLKGVVSGGTVADSPVVASGTIFWLPCGYAPDEAEIHAVLSNNQTGRVSVKWMTTIGCSNGQKRGMVTADPPSNNAWVSLDGITFRAAGS
jgi:hypothetical protein